MSSLFDRYGPRALILGGSEGIGASFASQLAAQGFALTLVGRRQAPLEKFAARLRSDHGVDVRILLRDLAAPGIENEAEAIIDEKDYGLVIYNAGAAHGIGLFVEMPASDAFDLVRLNCLAPTAFAHAALRRMRDRGKGGLLLVSSMSGLVGAGHIAVYGATKSFEIILAEGLHWEMKRHGVDVSCLVAGLTDTPAVARSGAILDGSAGFVAMASDDVAAMGLAALGQGPTCYAVGQQAADAIRAAPRDGAIEAMSQATVNIWKLDRTAGQ